MSEHFKKVILPLHLIALLVFPFGTWAYLDWTIFGWIMISGYGMAIGMHRYFCHNAFETSTNFHIVLGWLACLGSQGSPIFWNAVHQQHHKESDTNKDFHTPLKGWWTAYWGWIVNLDPREVPMRLSKRLLKDPYQKWMHKNYYRFVWNSVALVALLDFAITGGFYHVFYGMILPMCYATHQEPIVNVISHIATLGTRKYNTPDNSNNIKWLAWFTFGQAYHNNHHANPGTYDYGEGEFDPCKWMVKPLLK